jgi:hypothetical protein
VGDVRRQVVRVVVAAAVAGVVATGCGGPSQVGAAVIVGDRSTSLDAVQSRLSAALDKQQRIAAPEQPGGPAGIAREIVTQQVLHDLLTAEADEQGIVVTDQQVESELADRGGLAAVAETTLYDEATLREYFRDSLVAAQLARGVVGGLSVTFDLVGADSRTDAEEKAATLAAGGPAAERLLADPGTARSGQTVQAVTEPAAASSVLFTTPVGGVVAFRPDPESANWVVFRVTDRRTDVQSDPAALNGLGVQDLADIGRRLMQPVADEVGVRVNPRYGVWDPIQLRVVAEEDLAGEILPPAPSPAG